MNEQTAQSDTDCNSQSRPIHKAPLQENSKQNVKILENFREMEYKVKTEIYQKPVARTNIRTSIKEEKKDLSNNFVFCESDYQFNHIQQINNKFFTNPNQQIINLPS